MTVLCTIPAMHFIAAACSITKPNRVTTNMIDYWTTKHINFFYLNVTVKRFALRPRQPTDGHHFLNITLGLSSLRASSKI